MMQSHPDGHIQRDGHSTMEKSFLIISFSLRVIYGTHFATSVRLHEMLTDV